MPRAAAGKNGGAQCAPWLSLLLIGLLPSLILGYLAYLSFVQGGVVARIADWEYRRFGQTLPAFNVAVLVVFALVIGMLIDFFARRRFERQERATDGVEMQDSAGIAATRSAHGFARALTIVAAASLIAAAGITIWSLVLPSRAPLVEGQTLTGRADGRLMTTIVQDMMLTRHRANFIPLIDPAEPRTIRTFVEFVPPPGWNGASVPQVGSLPPMRAYRKALPSFVDTIYAERGYTVDRNYRVLVGRPNSIQMPYWIVAVQFAMLALVALVAALLQHRHVRRLERRASEAGLLMSGERTKS